MNDDTKRVGFNGQLDLASVERYLTELLSGLRARTVYVQSGPEAVALVPAERVNFRVEAKRKRDRQSLKMEIKWRAAEEAQETEWDLVISDAEPETVLSEDEEPVE